MDIRLFSLWPTKPSQRPQRRGVVAQGLKSLMSTQTVLFKPLLAFFGRKRTFFLKRWSFFFFFLLFYLVAWVAKLLGVHPRCPPGSARPPEHTYVRWFRWASERRRGGTNVDIRPLCSSATIYTRCNVKST